VKVHLKECLYRLVEVSSVVFNVACDHAVAEMSCQLTYFFAGFGRRGSGEQCWV